MRLVKINKRRWLVGLNWYVPSDDQNVRKTVEQEGSDCISRRGNQIGHGDSGGTPRMYSNAKSLAAWLSIPHNSFIGIFPLIDATNGETFWWEFARVNGNNVGGYGDTIYLSEEDAERGKKELMDLYPQYTSLDEVIICKSVEESLAWLTPRCAMPLYARLRGDAAIVTLDFLRNKKSNIIKRILWGLAAAATLVGVGELGMNFLTDLGVTREAKEKARQRELLREKYEKHPELLFHEEWRDAPTPRVAATRCLTAIRKSPINMAGWRLQDIICTAGKNAIATLTLDYAHTPMSNYERLPGRINLAAKKNQSVKNFKITEKIEHIPPPRRGIGFRELPSQERLRRAFLQMAQNLSLKVAMGFNAPVQKNVQDVGNYTCPWAVGTFEISSVPSPQIGGIGDILDGIPGLVVKEVRFDMDYWSIKGEVYGR